MAQTILTGNSYVNLHTAMYPNGEIRGNIKPD
ncbi:CHRD domain-containing protein [Hymenobacter sp. NBH84]|uniref:CHRD domain-containing protein n=1 Tax=Hymenobacter profundi TaxID=1982110 RepID=A0ABS6WVK4_9BACT|nr:CHRD domain-containing protein [Hymenobacter profundi]QNE41686.1 CHRD domain-containing protein [Hymenobacter sp. NBH84]